MDLHTGEPYWLMKNGYHQSFPALDADLRTEVCILGAGITGALAAHALVKEGVDVVVLDKRHPGMGSTCASTALLQYEIDEPLHTLINKAGRKRAEAAYVACYRAVDAIQAIIKSERLKVSFAKSPSLQYASRPRHAKSLQREYDARKRIGLDVQLLSQEDVQDFYGFAAPAALWSGQGAQVDAYELAHALLGRELGNLRVFDTCEAVDIRRKRKGLTVVTQHGHTVRADKLVVACGYESQKFLPKKVLELSSTYALIGKPVDAGMLWPDRTLLWETKTPYLYARTTLDNRIIVGGRDDESFDRKQRDAALPAKAAKLAGDFSRLFPEIPLQMDFIWAGAFGGTRDSLAYVGPVDGLDHTYFILGFGGNGIVFSQTGAEIVRDAILGRKNPLANLYAFSR